jgi:hypothetical protein
MEVFGTSGQQPDIEIPPEDVPEGDEPDGGFPDEESDGGESISNPGGGGSTGGQTGGGQTDGNHTGGNQTGDGQTDGNHASGNHTDGNHTGGNHTDGNHTDDTTTVDDTSNRDTGSNTDTTTTTTFTVTFVNYDGRVIVTRTVARGGNAAPPASNPSRVGHTFTGWSPGSENIQADRTIRAQYVVQTFTVTFEDWDGREIVVRTVEHGRNATPPADPSRVGHTFTGWNLSYENILATRTIRAQYRQNEYEVRFMDGSTVLRTVTVLHGEAATPPANPTREGYIFDGWDGRFGRVTEDRIITAQYRNDPLYCPICRNSPCGCPPPPPTHCGDCDELLNDCSC